MEYTAFLNYLKTSISRGYFFCGIAVLCSITLLTLVIIYGDVGSYDADPDNPNIMRGDRHDMPKDVFARYYLIQKTIAGIFLLNSIVSVFLYLQWKNKTGNSGN